ncbi:MAG: hypothetical protein JWM87_749 [Candidatus Eremiobacteraeota bacterium]|nr:hypothetical protein [Candidatus Eremiobacteraeota bacterium]
MTKRSALAPVSAGADHAIALSEPYVARIVVQGTAPFLFHAYNVESVEEKGRAAKGSAAKKSDDLESYVYRVGDDDERLGVPGANFCAALATAAKSMQDPRSPRKSMMDLVKASVIPLDPVAPFVPDVTEWDYVDRRRVVVQRNAVPRSRPAMHKGWKVAFTVLVNAPEYIPPDVLNALAVKAGMFQGVGDFRPTYGRFNIIAFEHGDVESLAKT